MHCERCDSNLSGFEETICMDCALNEMVSDAYYTQNTIQKFRDFEYSEEEIWKEILSNPHLVKSQIQTLFNLDSFFSTMESETNKSISSLQKKIIHLNDDAPKCKHSITQSVIFEQVNQFRSTISFLEDELQTLKKQIDDFR